MNENELMRNYAAIVNETIVNETIVNENESLGHGMIDIVQSRLGKTMGMIEHLMYDIRDDSPESYNDLDLLLQQLEAASSSIDAIRDNWTL